MRVRVKLDKKNIEEKKENGKGETLPLIDIPLLIGDRLIGHFELGHDSKASFSNEERKMLHTLASQAAIAIENARLFENTQKSYYDTIKSLAQALEARDPYTRGHSERVTEYSLSIASKMGLDEKEKNLIRYAGLLHDIGKIGISDSVLHCPTSLSDRDFAIVKDHTMFGDAILSPLKFLVDAQVIIRHHHERFDGAGYPEGLKGDAIPLASRIIAVADSYDAMTSDRPYRSAMPREKAVAEIRANSGTQFDPSCVDAFIAYIGS
jgi:putative nucleotidyltransferase with HDIG domain